MYSERRFSLPRPAYRVSKPPRNAVGAASHGPKGARHSGSFALSAKHMAVAAFDPIQLSQMRQQHSGRRCVRVDTPEEPLALDPLENTIHRFET
jgi:hypothetical protein